MTECWSPGDLRAYVDRELPPDDTARLEAHLEICRSCAAELREIGGRADRIAGLFAQLGTVPAPVRLRRQWEWPRRAAAVGLAACLALFAFYPKPQLPPKTAEVAQPFVALDNEPIDTGLVVRVALGPNQVQADVIIAPDGRPRAYRLVSNNEGVKTE